MPAGDHHEHRGPDQRDAGDLAGRGVLAEQADRHAGGDQRRGTAQHRIDRGQIAEPDRPGPGNRDSRPWISRARREIFPGAVRQRHEQRGGQQDQRTRAVGDRASSGLVAPALHDRVDHRMDRPGGDHQRGGQSECGHQRRHVGWRAPGQAAWFPSPLIKRGIRKNTPGLFGWEKRKKGKEKRRLQNKKKARTTERRASIQPCSGIVASRRAGEA